MNMYQYARNNPVGFVDLNGLWSLSADYYAGLGSGASVHYTEEKGFSVSFRAGVGIGAGVMFDPNGSSPSVPGSCGSSSTTFTGFAKAGLGAGPAQTQLRGSFSSTYRTPPVGQTVFEDGFSVTTRYPNLDFTPPTAGYSGSGLQAFSSAGSQFTLGN